jgi:chitin disaccharide deacetylase
MTERTGLSRKARVVLCADDFGLSEGVSRAILELAERGRISAASAMTNCPAFAGAAPRLKAFDGRVGIGLHLNLTAGAPLGPMPGFAPKGVFPPNGAVVAGALTARLPRREIAAEVERQLDAFEAAFGRGPDFVDGHQHVHVLPGLRWVLLEVLERRRLHALWLRDPRDDLGAILGRRIAAGKALVVEALALGFRKHANRAGFDTNEGFSGYRSFEQRPCSRPPLRGSARGRWSCAIRRIRTVSSSRSIRCRGAGPRSSPISARTASERCWRSAASSSCPALRSEGHPGRSIIPDSG